MMADPQGLSELRDNFRRLGRDMETRMGRLMVAAGGKVLKQAAIQNAQANGSVRTGVMLKNIAIKHERQAPAGVAQINLGVRHGAAGQTRKQRAANKRLKVSGGRIVVRYVNNPYYFRWVERGHRIVARAGNGEQGSTATTYQQRLRNGKWVTRTKLRSTDGLRARRAAATGMVAPKPFLAPAVRDNQQAAIDAMAARLDKELKKMGLMT